MKNIVLFGPGQVGQAVLEQLSDLIEYRNAPLIIAAVADSQGMICDKEGLSNDLIQRIILAKRKGASLFSLGAEALNGFLNTFAGPDTIIVDTSASDSMVHTLRQALEQDCGIVMANKKNLTQAWSLCKPFFNHEQVRYESTVCSGVPVMTSLRRLIRAGDTVSSIPGCLSGTLNYICTRFDDAVPFSQAVQSAVALGYTEPDPRDDLGGVDVARKALILARANGWGLEMEDIRIEKLYKDELGVLSTDDFLAQCSRMDGEYAALQQTAERQEMVLRYIAEVKSTGGKTQLVEVPRHSDFGSLKGSGNRIAFHSKYHNDNPLVISGTGAGAELTASGVIADILELAHIH